MNLEFDEAYNSTIGVDFFSKIIKFQKQNIRLQMWDTSGQEGYKGIIPPYVRGSSLVFLIYDVSSKSSFDNIPTWINFIRNIEKTTLVLCGNKIDLAERKVKKKEGEELAQQEGITFFEVTAKTGVGIKDMFYSSVADLLISDKNNFTTKENLVKENLVKELLQENENKNEKENENKNKNKNDTERSSLCSRCIDCCKNCFNSEEEN